MSLLHKVTLVSNTRIAIMTKNYNLLIYIKANDEWPSANFFSLLFVFLVFIYGIHHQNWRTDCATTKVGGVEARER